MNIEIRGFLETSLLDWDGKISSVIFLPGCNFRCPYCHNSPLISDPQSLKKHELEDVKKFLVEHKNWVDAVVISGGEPTIYEELESFIKEFKDLGFLVKLDTNGTRPHMLKSLVSKGLLDYVAMDIKGPLNGKYEKLAGSKVNLKDIMESIEFLKSSGLEYEFRTTVVPGLLDIEDIKRTAEELKDSKKFVIQQFEPNNSLDEGLREVKPYTPEKLAEIAEAAKASVPNTVLRGA